MSDLLAQSVIDGVKFSLDLQVVGCSILLLWSLLGFAALVTLLDL